MKSLFDGLINQLILNSPRASTTQTRPKRELRPTYMQESPTFLDELKLLRRENKSLKQNMKELQGHLQLQVSSKESELNRLKDLMSESCLIEKEDNSNETDERRDVVNDLDAQVYSSRDVQYAYLDWCSRRYRKTIQEISKWKKKNKARF